MTKVDKTLFEGEHYLGRPADHTDKIITRRVELVKQIPGFTGTDKDLLEIGCGNGATLLLMSADMNTCTGIDIFDHTAQFKQAKEAQGITNCKIEIRDIENVDLFDTHAIEKPLDRLICFEVIEHFNDDRSVQRITKWLKPGALCAISVPNKWWIFETHGAKLPLLPWNRVPFFSWLPRPIHERFANARIYTKGRIKKLMEQSGFEVLEMKYITAPMDVLKEGALKRFIVNNILNTETTKVPFFSTSIFVVARVK